jgi:hypothetical protein
MTKTIAPGAIAPTAESRKAARRVGGGGSRSRWSFAIAGVALLVVAVVMMVIGS